jgi:hypothetical protein
VLPAVSPDGKKLAFVTEASSGGPAPHVSYECSHGSEAAVVVMDLASGGTSTRPIGSIPISHLSWSADGTSLLISGGPVGGNKGWQLDTILLDGTNGIGVVPVTGANAPASYYREGVYLPGGGIVVNRVCCSGTPAKRQSSLILRIDPAGNAVHRIAQAFLDKDHTSLAVDPSGHWIMYLAGNDLFVSRDGAAPKNVAPGLVAATWL